MLKKLKNTFPVYCIQQDNNPEYRFNAAGLFSFFYPGRPRTYVLQALPVFFRLDYHASGILRFA
jgi:hypothetical protein